VIGIVDNLVFNDVFSATPQPMVISKASAGDLYGSANRLFIRIKPQTDVQAGLSKIEEVIKQFNLGQNFDFFFIFEDFGRLISSEKLTGILASLFAALAIIISCLGIFGLSAFSAEQRTREIGIRKIMGASVWSIVNLLGRSFMLLILLAFVIAIPVSWYVSNQWLQDYAYRISLGWYIFAGTGLLVASIAIFTVNVQSMKAATTNPVKAIKSE
jgi:ABC-type antimicrobial peptide transport system permease subunit